MPEKRNRNPSVFVRGSWATVVVSVLFWCYVTLHRIHIGVSRMFVNCNALQHTATHCNTLQHTTRMLFVLTLHSILIGFPLMVVNCNALQYAAIHCNNVIHECE